MNKIDIVIPWLNPTENWYNEYKKYSENENVCRIRDLNTMRYVLRGIDAHCPWVNKVVLLMYDEEQVPDWINKDCEKLRIVYHKDFIPKEFLPNFNSEITANYIHKIKDISDVFLYMNDDMVITKDLPLNMYYENDKAVHHPSLKAANWPIKPQCQWHEILNSSFNFIKKITGKSINIDTKHMPMPVDKRIQEFIWFKHENDLLNSCKNARIRKAYTITNEIYYVINEIYKNCKFRNIYHEFNCKAMWLSDNTSEKEIHDNLNNCSIVCLNDSEMLNDDQRMRNIITRNCEEVLPNKSCFEV